ncbi:MAG: hypothetical protein JWO67_1385 [Streptosporangiaceae bacterium]|nr:hypothetical protein [Streptosporangiaceae bacterium]
MDSSGGPAGSPGRDRADRRPATVEIPLPAKPAVPGPVEDPVAGGEPGSPEETTGLTKSTPAVEPDPADGGPGAAETRADLPLPKLPLRRRPPPAPANPPTLADEAPLADPVPPQPPLSAQPRPGQWATASAAAREPAPEHGWHPFHYLIGVFLVAYGVTGLIGTLVGWDGHHRDLAGYLAKTVGGGAGAVTPSLICVKVVEALLTLAALAGVLRRADVWLLPATIGWIAGFAAFCVLDLWAGFWGRLVVHLVYLLVLAVLLAVSYALSVKVRVGRAAASGRTPAGAAPGNLTRTQEMALAAITRWPRGASAGD